MAEPESEGSARTSTTGSGFNIVSRLKNKFHSRSSSKDDRTPPSAAQIASKPPTAKGKDGNETLISTLAQSTIGVSDRGQARADHGSPGINLVAVPASTMPITSHAEPSHKISSQVIPVLSPICELWNQAYDDLLEKEKTLVKDYEDTLSGNLKKMIGSTVVLSSSKMERKDQMEIILKLKVAEVNQNAWKLKFSDKEVAVKDLMQPVVGIIDWANDYIDNAVSANPYASIAWAGVSLLLPLFLNPSKQAASLVNGLEYLSGLIVQSSIREDLYSRRYESNSSDQDRKAFLPSHVGYRETLKELYTRILKFQAMSICYYSKNAAFRIGLDMVIWNGWDSLLADIQKQEKAFRAINDLWKDTRYEEEYITLEGRHQESMKGLISIGRDVSGLRKAIEDTQRDSQRTELLSWLSSVDPSENYNSALEKHEAKTGDWLVRDNKDFKYWELASNSLLWLHGKALAGSGKSVLSSSVIKHLRDSHDSDPQTALGFFYFSFNDVEKQNTVGMLASLTKQLCCRRPDTPQPVKDLGQYKDRGQHPDMKTLEATLAATIRGFSEVYLVIDALDECPFECGEQRRLLDSLCRIHETASENLHLFCTSRRESDIEAALNPLLASPSKIAVDLLIYRDVIDYDIGLYIDRTLASSDYASWPEDLKAEARAILIKNADGMFQYISCQFEDLRKHTLPSLVRKLLKDLPKGLDATYDRMLQSINPDVEKQVRSLLKWLAFSLRPLSSDELSEAFVLDYECPVPFDKAQGFSKPEDVLKYLPGLVTSAPIRVDRYGSVWDKTNVIEIRLAHFSIKEYLASPRMRQGPTAKFSISEPDAHQHISESCLAYHLQISEIELTTKESLKQFTLWEYAALHWTSHLEMVARGSWTTSVTGRVTQVFTPGAQSLLNRIRIEDPDNWRRPNWGKRSDELASPLYYAASLGALQLTDLLIKSGADVNAQGGDYGNALQAAAYHGNESIVLLLLDRSADINAQGGLYGNALQVAITFGNEIIVQILLDRGADVNAQGGEYGNALQAAAYRGNESIVKLLLDRGADVNAQGGDYGNALQAAVYHGNEGIVELFLDGGADVNARGGEYGNALQAAAYRGNEGIVMLLLDRGADINTQGGYFGNSLLAAVARDHLNIAQLLLLRGAQVDPPGAQWKELLTHMKAEYGRESADRLRKFREGPTEFLDSARREDPTKLLISMRRGNSTIG